MSDHGPVITYDNAAELIRRLRSVSEDDYLCSRYYPIVIESLLGEKYANGVVNALSIAIDAVMAQGAPLATQKLLIANLTAWLRALIDDVEVLERALSFAVRCGFPLKEERGEE